MRLTDWLAIYAAVLSTVIFVWKIWQARPRLRVIVTYGIEGTAFGACVTIQNCSSQTVHLAGVSILYHDRVATQKDWLSHAWQFKRFPKRLGWVYSALSNYNVEDSCPMALQAHDSHHFIIEEDTVEKIFSKTIDRKIIAVVQDRLWNNVYSNVFEYSVSHSSRSGA